jgi:tetratricopeptide (TPR) repeat protein
LAPLPRLVLGEEAQAAARIPQDRADVTQAEAAFKQAQSLYKTYVASHDVGAALNKLEKTLTTLQADFLNNQLMFAFQSAAQPVTDYAAQLQAYASTGETYFSAIKRYDDELMAWTRSLGADSESLRPDTWPIVEYLKLYPPPSGEKADYTNFTAADVSALMNTLAATAPLENDDALLRYAGSLSQYGIAITRLREAGRSIEYVESLHSQYFTLLKNYDTKLQAAASGSGGSNLSGSRTIIATATNLLVGAALVVGLVAIFLPRGRKENEAAV